MQEGISGNSMAFLAVEKTFWGCRWLIGAVSLRPTGAIIVPSAILRPMHILRAQYSVLIAAQYIDGFYALGAGFCAKLSEFAPCSVGLQSIVGEFMEFPPFTVGFLRSGLLLGLLNDKYTFKDSHLS